MQRRSLSCSTQAVRTVEANLSREVSTRPYESTTIPFNPRTRETWLTELRMADPFPARPGVLGVKAAMRAGHSLFTDE
jgi:hypothetical protein